MKIPHIFFIFPFLKSSGGLPPLPPPPMAPPLLGSDIAWGYNNEIAAVFIEWRGKQQVSLKAPWRLTNGKIEKVYFLHATALKFIG